MFPCLYHITFSLVCQPLLQKSLDKSGFFRYPAFVLSLIPTILAILSFITKKITAPSFQAKRLFLLFRGSNRHRCFPVSIISHFPLLVNPFCEKGWRGGGFFCVFGSARCKKNVKNRATPLRARYRYDIIYYILLRARNPAEFSA